MSRDIDCAESDSDAAAIVRANRRATLVGAVIALLVSVVLFGGGAYLLVTMLSERDVLSSQTSPDGELVLVVALYEDVTVEVHRYSFGVLVWHRTLARGRAGLRPKTRWLDDRTVLIGDERVDVYRGDELRLPEPPHEL